MPVSLSHRSVCTADQHTPAEEHVSGDSVLDGSRGKVLSLSHGWIGLQCTATLIYSSIRAKVLKDSNAGWGFSAVTVLEVTMWRFSVGIL